MISPVLLRHLAGLRFNGLSERENKSTKVPAIPDSSEIDFRCAETHMRWPGLVELSSSIDDETFFSTYKRLCFLKLVPKLYNNIVPDTELGTK